MIGKISTTFFREWEEIVKGTVTGALYYLFFA